MCISIYTFAYLLKVDNSGNKDDCKVKSLQSSLVYEESYSTMINGKFYTYN